MFTRASSIFILSCSVVVIAYFYSSSLITFFKENYSSTATRNVPQTEPSKSATSDPVTKSSLSDEHRVIDAWTVLIKEPSYRFRRLAVGTNANLDLIVRHGPFMESLEIKPGHSRNHEVMNNLQQFQETFAFFFEKGSAAERIFNHREMFMKIVEQGSSVAGAQNFIGGNAALVANKVKELFPEVEVQLVGPVGPKLASLLPASLLVSGESKMTYDEVHIIVEYKAGESWGDRKTGVSNRFIFSNDESNSRMTKLEHFFQNMEKYQPDSILLAGLHLLEMQDEEFYKQKLNFIRGSLTQLPLSVPVHLELASMVNKKFMEHILQRRNADILLDIRKIVFRAFIKWILDFALYRVTYLTEVVIGFLLYINRNVFPPIIDAKVCPTIAHLNLNILPGCQSLGLNEQELTFAAHAGNGPHKNYFSEHEGQPEINVVGDILLWLMDTYGHSKKNDNYRLTRIHFHSLTFHMTAVYRNSWTNIDAATAAGTRSAGPQACDVTVANLKAEQVELRIPKKYQLYSKGKSRTFNPEKPVVSENVNTISLTFSPVLVCKKVVKTVGLGDAISATGLMFSDFNKKFFS